MKTDTPRTGCPKCKAPPVATGQPSKRQFFACESYCYDNEPEKLVDQTDLCATREELAEMTRQRDKLRALLNETYNHFCGLKK